MGNETSNSNEEKDDKLEPRPMSQILDYIATYYILTMDFKSLRKLYNKEYCDKLVILTSDIIERYYTNIEITYLSQRTKEGADINEKDKVIFFNKDLLDKVDIKNPIKKKNICPFVFCDLSFNLKHLKGRYRHIFFFKIYDDLYY